MASLLVPSHVNESTEPVDNLGGIVSVVLVGSLVLSINFAPVPDKGALGARPRGVALVAAVGVRPPPAPRAEPPVRPGHRPSAHLLGRRLRRHHRLRLADGDDVHQPAVPAERAGYSTLQAGAAFLPAIVCMVLVAPRSAKLVESHGARITLLTGYVFLVLAFSGMLLLWSDDAPYWQIGIAYAFIGIGVGLAGTPASHSLTGSVPVQPRRHGVGHRRPAARPGRRDHAIDLGALLTAGYASAAATAIAAAPNSDTISDSVQSRADEVVCRRRRHRRPVPAVLRPDHRRRPHLVSARRRLGLHRRPRRRAPRSRPGLDLLPPARRGATPTRPLPRRGHRRSRGSADGGPPGCALTRRGRSGTWRPSGRARAASAAPWLASWL